MSQGTSKDVIELIFCWPSTTGHVTYPQDCQGTFPLRKLSFHLQVFINYTWLSYLDSWDQT